MSLHAADIIAELVAIGVFPEDAATAAADPRLAWDDAALDGCIAWATDYQGDVPGGVMLWTKFLRVGWFPPFASIAPQADTTLCPFSGCDQGRDLSRCKGIHGTCWECHGPLRECLGQHANAQQEAA